VLACGLLLLGGCLKRVDAPLPLTVRDASRAVHFSYAGSFGGQAVREVDSDDPWEVRFRPGGFVDVAGLCVHDDEVWVCDLGISRLQVFDLDGNFLRQYGAGVPIAGTLLSRAELYFEEQDYPYGAEVKPPRWEDGPGRPWVLDRVNLFRAADVAVTDDGYLLADQTRTGGEARPRRTDEVALIHWDGTRENFGTTVAWPAYLGVEDKLLAVAMSPGNGIVLGEIASGNWPSTLIGTAPNFQRVMEVELDLPDMSNYQLGYDLATEAGSGPRKFNGVGGLAVAFDKAVVCDTGNQKLKIYDVRRTDAFQWGTMIRAVTARKSDGSIRFIAPRAVAIDSAGSSYVIDVNPRRTEVAVLDPVFDRVGSFGADRLSLPVDIAVSADGRHCYVTDRRENQVLHYVRGD